MMMLKQIESKQIKRSQVLHLQHELWQRQQSHLTSDMFNQINVSRVSDTTGNLVFPLIR